MLTAFSALVGMPQTMIMTDAFWVTGDVSEPGSQSSK